MAENENKDHIFCEDLPDDEETPDYPAIHYVRGKANLFPPASRGAPFDPLSVTSTIIRLSGLALDTTFQDLSNWLNGIVAFQGVICPHGEAFIEVIQPSDARRSSLFLTTPAGSV